LGPMPSGNLTQLAIGAIMVVSINNFFSEFARSPANTNISVVGNLVANSGRTGIWIADSAGGVVKDNVIAKWNQHPELPVWGLDSNDLPIALQDFSRAVAVRFSSNVSLTNNLMLPSTTYMSLDGPANNATISQPFNTGGWAVDLGASSGTGVDAIHVW